MCRPRGCLAGGARDAHIVSPAIFRHAEPIASKGSPSRYYSRGYRIAAMSRRAVARVNPEFRHFQAGPSWRHFPSLAPLHRRSPAAGRGPTAMPAIMCGCPESARKTSASALAALMLACNVWHYGYETVTKSREDPRRGRRATSLRDCPGGRHDRGHVLRGLMGLPATAQAPGPAGSAGRAAGRRRLAARRTARCCSRSRRWLATAVLAGLLVMHPPALAARRRAARPAAPRLDRRSTWSACGARWR